MELLGMGENVQCNGYFPGYYSTRDLMFDSEGSTWTSSNVNSEPKNNCYQNGSLPVSSPCNLLGYNKEFLKQTILKHEAIFRDQIHELHRVYHKQKELMEEIRRNELYKQNLSLEASWSGSSLSSKNTQKICCAPNLPWSAGQSSVIAASFRMSLASAQENTSQLCPGPAVTKDPLKDSKRSASKYRKVGKKKLDLQLPADEYIFSEEGECLKNERVTEVPQLSAHSLNGIYQVGCDSDAKPYRTDFNGFTNLNLPFKLREEAAAKSYDLGVPTHHGRNPFYDVSRVTKLRSQNLPSDVIQNLNKRQDLEACPDNSLPDQGKKHEQLSSDIRAGQSGGVLDAFPKGRKFSISESSARPQGSTSNGSVRPSSASHTCALYPLFSGADMISFGISPAELWKNDPNSSDHHVSSDRHELRKYVLGSEDVRTPKNLNLNITPPGYSDTTTFQSIQITGEENKFQDSTRGLPWLKGKPVCKGKPNEKSKVSNQIESVLLNSYKAGGIHGLKSKKIQETDLSTEKTLSFHNDGKPHMSSDVQSFHVFPSEAFQNRSKNHRIEEIDKGCISEVKSHCIHVPDMGEQTSADEHLMKDEQRKHGSLAGIIDLNSCMLEDEDMQMDVDFQAPASPENKECSPPRGESDENQVEMPLLLAGQEDPEVQEEQTRTAAEALVSISGFVAQNGLQMTTGSSSESFLSSPLHWFAGIVSTTVDHLDDEIKADFSGMVDNVEEFLPADMDYFEFMTLNLTETKDLDCCCKSIGQTEQVAVSTSPTQPRKGRGNRGRWQKDFQSEILPSLSSLSRYEVTEDLQTIGGLVAAGTHSETGSLRSTGRNVMTRGRRRSCTSTSNITDLQLNLKQLTTVTELDTEKGGLISWGKTCRKRRGHRIPITNPKFILNQVHN